jgi:hypothetical protein
VTDEVAKGVNFVFAKEYILKTHGEEIWARALVRLPASQRKIWSGILVPFGDYSFTAFKSMVRAVSTEAGEKDDAALAKMYEYIADRSLNAMYKVFFRLTRPSFVIRNYPKLWSRFFSDGSVKVPSVEAGRAEMVFELSEIFLDWIGPACLGYSTKAVTMSGGHGVAVTETQRKELPGGAWVVTFDVRWNES